MGVETVVTMVLSLGIIWGGFFVILITALRKERLKEKE